MQDDTSDDSTDDSTEEEEEEVFVPKVTQDTFELMIDDTQNFEIVPMRSKKNPSNHWVVPFITGHKYFLR